MSPVTPTMDWRELPRPGGRQLPVIVLAGLVFFVGAPALFGASAVTGSNWALLAHMAAVATSVTIVVRVLLSADRQGQDTHT